MRYCYDGKECRPVHGIDVTGGSFPATIWSLFMQVALERTDVLTFQTPAYEPTRVINPLPPPPPPKKEGTAPGQEKKSEKSEGEDDDILP